MVMTKIIPAMNQTGFGMVVSAGFASMTQVFGIAGLNERHPFAASVNQAKGLKSLLCLTPRGS